jgi:hypothetical protein
LYADWATVGQKPKQGGGNRALFIAGIVSPTKCINDDVEKRLHLGQLGTLKRELHLGLLGMFLDCEERQQLPKVFPKQKNLLHH